MKKMLPLITLFALTCTDPLHAQVRLGLLGGLHSSNILETNNIQGWDSAVKKYRSSRSGVQVGVIIEVPIGHSGFFFQPAILYTTKGRKYNRSNDSATSFNTDTVYARQNLNVNYIDVPLNFTYKIPLSANHKNSFFISAGPQISFFYSGKQTDEVLSYSANKYSSETNPVSVGSGPNTYKTVDLGINGRAGFELGNVLLSAYFSRGLTNFYNATYTGDFHHQLAGASLGIWLTSTGAAPPRPKKDTDKDGIPDDQDLCPLKPGSAAWHGCPVPDSDKDGINDEHDSCKNIPGLARYNGCPIPDTDHDGVNDEEDKCPQQAGVARYQGCPVPDRDGDGLNDEEDKCPDSTGAKENQGCPVIKKEATEQIKYIAKNILFTSASDQLTDSSYTALNELAGLMTAHPEWHLTIEGYTDNRGAPEKNLALSAHRAEAVLAYLVRKGIPGTRLTAAGRGQDSPIADNRTEAGRAVNRRVELRISLEKQ